MGFSWLGNLSYQWACSLQQTNILVAMENGPFVDELPIGNAHFPIAMFVYQTVCIYIHTYIYVYNMCMKNNRTIAAVFSRHVADDQRRCGFVWVVHHTKGQATWRTMETKKKDKQTVCVFENLEYPTFSTSILFFFLWCLHHCATNTIMLSRFVASGERRGSHSHWDHQEGVVQLSTSNRWGLLLVDL